jgi:3-deoxy-D-manno-octulosonate 8-phosphate phosphatase (KDO 8-P phosphatase)
MVSRPRPSLRLSAAELRRRAARLRLVVTDSDGVLTDAGVYYSARGEELKRFSIRDGMGVERLGKAGIRTAILTGEKSPSLERRAEKLGIEGLYLGVRDKGAALDKVLADHGVELEEVAYIGDDVNDLDPIDRIAVAGLTGAPADALPDVLERVHYRCALPGGHGAFRDFAEWILRPRKE